MTDDQARNVQQYEYDSFGNQHDMKNRIKQPYGYTGREHDRETGLRYYRARYYDGEVGRFISEDLIGIVGGINQYVYTNNNAVNYTDPSGLLTCTYDISSHTLTCTNNAGNSFATSNAKSGQGQCQDNIECVDQENEGPIPPGSYSISPPGYSTNHPTWLYLDPDPNNEMYDRSEFFIHGWGVSEGCVTIHYNTHRDMVEEWATQDNGGTLNVVP